MHTTSSPKELSDLRYQDNVIHLKDGQSVETTARKWFHELFSNDEPVSCNLIIQEREIDEEDDNDPVYLGKDVTQVWECYQDSGSIDYLYIVDKGK